MNINATKWLLWLLGAPLEQVRGMVEVSLAWRGIVPVEAVVLGGVALGAWTLWLYRRAELTVRQQWILSGLRTAFWGLLLLLLLRPTLALVVEGTARQKLIVLLDGSASMNIRDPRTTSEDQRRAALLTATRNPSRLELAQAALAREQSRWEREFDLSVHRFGARLEPVASVEWRADSSVTALGDVVREALARARGQPVAGLWLLTDGAHNSGSDPLAAAAQACQEGVPLYIYGIGLRAPKDLIVASMWAEDVVFVNDTVTVTVRLHGQGVREPVTVTLQLGPEVVAREVVTLAGEREQIVSLSFTPTSTGEFVLQASVPVLADEAVADNNRLTKPIRVVDQRIKVLYVERAPRWEFRYLLATWLRDRRVQLQCVLEEGDPGLATGADSPYLAALPQTREEWLAYDVIVVGDVDASRWSPTQLAALEECVAQWGSGLIFVAGAMFNPRSYRATPLARLLPVELNPASREETNRPLRLELTPAGRANPMLRLAEGPQESGARWSALPAVFWLSPVGRAKPAAEVLVRESAGWPVWVLHRYGAGQVLFVGTDETWRWRKNVGDQYYARLWGQTVQRLAMTRQLSGAKRTQLIADRQQYFSGERVTIYGRLYTPAFQPVTETVVRGRYRAKVESAADAADQSVQLRPLPGQPGMYRGEFLAPAPGVYQFGVETDPSAGLEFRVTLPQYELGDTAMNEPLLRQMAEISGGVFVHEEGLAELREQMVRRSAPVRAAMDVALWCSPLYFLVMLGVITAEWILRKRWQLK